MLLIKEGLDGEDEVVTVVRRPTKEVGAGEDFSASEKVVGNLGIEKESVWMTAGR